jgi:hypothetical protein
VAGLLLPRTVVDLDFVIVTAGALPEAYFLAAFLALHAQRLAIVNVVRPAASRLPALARACVVPAASSRGCSTCR